MKTSFTSLALVVAVTAGTAFGQSNSFDAQAEINALRAEVQQLRAQGNESWLNERRTEEVRTLIREVLSDADTRASLAEGGMTAGHNGQKFFLASEDGSFLMNIEGQIQFRWTWNMRDNDTDDTDDHESGFTLRRTKLRFSGHIADPKLHYVVQFQVNDSDNSMEGDIITIAYDLTDTLTIKIGEDKAPFLHEELVSSKRQLAAERSLVNELFTMDVVQGIFLDWDAHEQVHVAAALSDGGRSGEAGSSVDVSGTSVGRVKIIDLFDDFNTTPDDPDDDEISKDFNEDGTDLAITARVDILLSGSWGQGDDFSAGLGEELYARIGGAIHYEVNESGDPDSDDADDFLMWTIDAAVEYRGFSVFVAFTMAHTDFEESSSDDYDPWGLVVQGSYNIDLGNGDSIEPFVRWERIDFDGAVDDGDTIVGSSYSDELDLLTVGVNWYHKGHAAKFTADVVWAFDAIAEEVAYGGAGILTDENSDDDDQMVLRLQYQLLF